MNAKRLSGEDFDLGLVPASGGEFDLNGFGSLVSARLVVGGKEGWERAIETQLQPAAGECDLNIFRTLARVGRLRGMSIDSEGN